MKLIYLALFSTLIFSQSIKTGQINGVITDAANKDLLMGVNVSLMNTSKGAMSSETGEFKILDVKHGSYKLKFEYVGYKTYILTDVIIKPDRVTHLNIKLYEDALSGDVVEITANYFQKDETTPISVVSFSTEEIRRSPGAGGEISRILNALPSVASRGEDSQDLMVRGGSPIENQFLIDNIPVPSVKHFETSSGASNGPIGIINTALVSDVQFFSGGFNASYGGNLSSVTDVSYREGNRSEFDGEIGMDFTGFSTILEGPIADGKGSYFFSARRSYLDIVSNAIGESGAPRFEDAQTKIAYDVSPSDKVTFLGVLANSEFDDTDLDNALENDKTDLVFAGNKSLTVGSNWRHTFGTKAISNIAVSGSKRWKELDIKSLQLTPTTINDNEYQNYNFRGNASIFLSKGSTLNFGMDFKRDIIQFNYFFAAETLPTGETMPDTYVKNSISGSTISGYTSFSYQLSKNLNTTLGFRVSNNTYNDDTHLSPRFNFSYQIDERSSLNFAYSKVFQNVPQFLASQSESIKEMESMRAEHFIFGFDYLLTQDTKATIEVFRKNYSHMPQRQTNVNDPTYPIDARFGQFFTELEATGKARSYGVELLVQKKLAEDFYGMVSGSYFRSEYKDQFGAWQDRVFDNKYLFSIIGGYKPNDTWEFSARWSLIGGRPYTPIDVNSSINSGYEVRDMTNFHGERLAAYHSLFLRADRRFYYEKSSLVMYMTLWNAYSNENVNRVFWNPDKTKIVEDKGFSLLPVIGMKYEF